MGKPAQQNLFELFNEIGIIDQLANNLFNRRMPLGLSVAHFSVINHLHRLGDGRTLVAIASAFQVTKPTMTSNLSKLSALGLVDIKPNPNDGRSKLVFLTARGRQFREDAIASVAPDLDRLARNLDMKSLLNLVPTLQELRTYLDHNRPS